MKELWFCVFLQEKGEIRVKRKFMLVLSAILAMNSMPVFAAGKNSVTGIADSQEIEVSGVYQETAEAEKIISADIKWDSMTFIYAKQSEGS